MSRLGVSNEILVVVNLPHQQGWKNFEQSCFVHSFEHAQNALHKIRISCSMLTMNAQNPIMSFYQLLNVIQF